MRSEKNHISSKLPKVKIIAYKQDITFLISVFVFVCGLLNWLLSNY
jgi:hypothetical protein